MIVSGRSLWPFTTCICGHVYWAHWYLTTGQCAHCDCKNPRQKGEIKEFD